MLLLRIFSVFQDTSTVLNRGEGINLVKEYKLIFKFKSYLSSTKATTHKPFFFRKAPDISTPIICWELNKNCHTRFCRGWHYPDYFHCRSAWISIAKKVCGKDGNYYDSPKLDGCNYPPMIRRRKQRLTIWVKPWTLRRDDQGACLRQSRSGTWTRRFSFSKVHVVPSLISSERTTSSLRLWPPS